MHRSPLFALAAAVFVSAVRAELPAIAVFAGPTATILNSVPPRTSLKAREKHNLPALTDWYGKPVRRDELVWQRLAAPVTVYIEAFTAHPLERDAADLFAPPDGYLDAEHRFHRERRAPTDRPVYEVTLKPEDGLYPLPYMARRADGSAWESWEGLNGGVRQTFAPDAARLFEEIERSGATTQGNLSGRARFHFYRPAPPGGYTRGLPAAERTDQGQGDLAPERPGQDFFPYAYENANPTRQMLAKITNDVQETLASGTYRGAFWLEGSTRIEDTAYWLDLLIDTDAMVVGVAAQRMTGLLSPDAPLTLADAVDFVLSDAWRDENGRNRIGAVLVQDQVVLSAREAIKVAPRPGGYTALGGHGGVLGSTRGPRITFVPTRRHGRQSEVNYSRVPPRVSGTLVAPDGRKSAVSVAVKDESGRLRGEAIPHVELAEFNDWMTRVPPMATDPTVDRIQAAVARALKESPLSGLVAEGQTGGHFDAPEAAALERAAHSGIVVVKVFRDAPGAFVPSDEANLLVEGSNLNATKARILLTACLLRFGEPPPARDVENPTDAERDAVRAHLKRIQAVFDTH